MIANKIALEQVSDTIVLGSMFCILKGVCELRQNPDILCDL